MSPLKRLLRSSAVVSLTASTIALYIRFVRATSRWQTIGAEHPQARWAEKAPCVVAFWHGRLLMQPQAWIGSNMKMYMLISQHRDGELIARTMSWFDIDTVRGSGANRKKADKNKGGYAALRAMVQVLKDGNCIGVTPDGPRGPRMRASSGVVAAARLAKQPILPLAYATRRRIMLDTWDRFLLPLPFTRGVTIWGAPVDVHSNTNESLEEAALRLEAALSGITAQADRLCGHEPVEPAPAEASRIEQNHAART